MRSTSTPAASTALRITFGALVLACLPYLLLKAAWVGGSTIGIPATSVLLEGDRVLIMRAVNALTFGMDAIALGLGLALVHRRGRDLPGWLLAVPAWLATGFLAPILLALPLQLAVGVTVPESAGEPPPNFLEPWVFTVVYAGFGAQALTLGILFARYVHTRWSALWASPAATVPPATAQALRGSAVVAVLLAAIPLALQMLWASGSRIGLNAAATDGGTNHLVQQATYATGTLAGVVGLLLLARRPGTVRRVPLALTWAGSATLAAWGAWLVLTSLGEGLPGQQPTSVMMLVYATQLAAGLWIGCTMWHVLAERSHALAVAARDVRTRRVSPPSPRPSSGRA